MFGLNKAEKFLQGYARAKQMLRDSVTPPANATCEEIADDIRFTNLVSLPKAGIVGAASAVVVPCLFGGAEGAIAGSAIPGLGTFAGAAAGCTQAISDAYAYTALNFVANSLVFDISKISTYSNYLPPDGCSASHPENSSNTED